MCKTVYYTKYALTSGIQERILEKYDDEGYATLRKWPKEYGNSGIFVSRKEVSETLEDALVVAEEMRIRKLASLDKQIKKISALEFKIQKPNGA